jgi:hypothetical protein
MKIFESYHEPGPDVLGCDYTTLNNAEVKLLDSDNRLKGLINNRRISLHGNKLWYFEDDESVIDLLDNIFGGLVENFKNFTEFLNECEIHEENHEFLVDNIKNFVIEWMGDSLNIEGEIDIDGCDCDHKYKYTIKIDKFNK